jgi:hypothetical protein
MRYYRAMRGVEMCAMFGICLQPMGDLMVLPHFEHLIPVHVTCSRIYLLALSLSQM